MTTREIKEFLGNKIQEWQEKKLAKTERLAVKYPREILEYKPSHGVGEFLPVFSSSQFAGSKNTGSVVQDEDIRIVVFTAVRVLDQGKYPEEYTDLLKAALSGIRMNANRADKFVHPELIQWVKDENQYVWYEVTFIVPAVNVQEIGV